MPLLIKWLARIFEAWLICLYENSRRGSGGEAVSTTHSLSGWISVLLSNKAWTGPWKSSQCKSMVGSGNDTEPMLPVCWYQNGLEESIIGGKFFIIWGMTKSAVSQGLAVHLKGWIVRLLRFLYQDWLTHIRKQSQTENIAQRIRMILNSPSSKQKVPVPLSARSRTHADALLLTIAPLIPSQFTPEKAHHSRMFFCMNFASSRE